MNKGIANILLNRLGTLPFIDLYGGIVSVQEKEDFFVDEIHPNGKKVLNKFPVACDVIDHNVCAVPGKLVPMIPDSKRKGILYFEDMGVVSNGRKGIYMDFTSSLRLVVWLNTKHINLNPCFELTMPVMAHILSRLTNVNPFNSNNFLRINISVNKIPQANKDIFSKYTYDLAITQYLMQPFEFFALDLLVNYSILPSCINEITIKTPSQC